MNDQKEISNIQRTLATVLSGITWYLANHLSGDFGFLLWIAPLPLLIIAYRSSAKQTFYFTFLAYLIGRLSWVSYLLLVIPAPLAIFFTVLLPITYALVIFGVRKLVKSGNPWLALFAYPALYTAFEFIAHQFSVDGTAASLAYTQSNFLPLIQIASVTGIYGIIFVTALVSSTLAAAWHFREHRQSMVRILVTGSLIILGVQLYGWMRIKPHDPVGILPVAMTVVEEKLHQFTNKPDIAAEIKVAEAYLDRIQEIKEQGTSSIVLFPEKAIQAKETDKDSLVDVLRNAAVMMDITIVGGVTVVKSGSRQNLVEFASSDGKVQEYMKNFHVTGWESDFERGKVIGHLEGLPYKSGMAICKDMDFPRWIREYHDDKIMFVPAWDFEVDGWLHSRMAIMRGVEYGFTLVRAARQGRLSVTDPWGRVIAEANCEDGKALSLTAQAAVYNVQTIYGKWGDWFGWLCVGLTLLFIIIAWRTK